MLDDDDDDAAAAANDFSSEDGKGDFELEVRSRPRLLISFRMR